MILREGDLFDTESTILGHGVNTQGFMGAGIAATFKEMYPEMFRLYQERCLTRKLQPGQVLVWEDANGDTVLNLASQDWTGPNAKYAWLQSSLVTAVRSLGKAAQEQPIALPRVGAGIGGLEWAVVSEMLLGIEARFGVEFEIWTLPKAPAQPVKPKVAKGMCPVCWYNKPLAIDGWIKSHRSCGSKCAGSGLMPADPPVPQPSLEVPIQESLDSPRWDPNWRDLS